MNKTTIIVIVSAVLALIGYDVYALSVNGTEASISYTIVAWSYKYPILPFVFGFLMGHFFWRIRNVKGTDQWGKD